VDLLVLGVGDAYRPRAALAVLAGFGSVEHIGLAAAAEPSAVDAVLGRVGGRRLVVLAPGTAGLNIVVLRLLRRSLLADTPVGVVLGDPRWMTAAGLPAAPAAAAEVAATGAPAPMGLVRDDHGGIVLSSAVLRPWAPAGRTAGRTVGLRAYVEDAELAHGSVRALVVHPADGALVAAVRPRPGLLPGLRRARALRGRAVTVSCAEARLTVDGVDLPRPQTRRTWWYEPGRWQLVRPRPIHPLLPDDHRVVGVDGDQQAPTTR